CNARAVKHEATSVHKFSPAVYRREPVLCREVCKLCSVRIEHGASKHEDCLSTSLVCGSECSLNILRTYYVQVLKPHPERRCGELPLFLRLCVSRPGRRP